MTLQTSIDIHAPAARVWEVLMDFERHTEWNPLIRKISGEQREGARLTALLGPPGKKPVTFKPLVSRFDPEREFAWLGALGAKWIFSGEHFFRLEPFGTEGTRFHHGERFSGLLVPVLRRSLETDIRRGFEAMNEALKDEAER